MSGQKLTAHAIPGILEPSRCPTLLGISLNAGHTDVFRYPAGELSRVTGGSAYCRALQSPAFLPIHVCCLQQRARVPQVCFFWTTSQDPGTPWAHTS